MEKVLTLNALVVFGDGLESVKFIQDGHIVDPRLVLQALAAGAARITYAEKRDEDYRLRSQTFTVESTS